MIKIINDFLTAKEISTLVPILEQGSWIFGAYSHDSNSSRRFWKKELINTEAVEFFTNKIQHSLGCKIIVYELYVNGQAHGQCGEWHWDVHDPSILDGITLVYFLKEWQPEYGGHLLIKTDNIMSILPEQNKAVLFESVMEHVGLEPTIHCKTQRESIACKFRVINDKILC